MTVYFVTRHKGARAWAEKQGIEARFVDHLDVSLVTADDIVYGTLPVHLAGDVCKIGARYFHLSLNIPQHLRGHELSETDLATLGATLQEYKVTKA